MALVRNAKTLTPQAQGPAISLQVNSYLARFQLFEPQNPSSWRNYGAEFIPREHPRSTPSLF